MSASIKNPSHKIVEARFQRAGGGRVENGPRPEKKTHGHVENLPPQPSETDSKTEFATATPVESAAAALRKDPT